jgi:hypothetical protein
LEKSRVLLEQQGVRLAAVSYDSQDVLRAFAEKYRIGFPLLSDRDSAVIRRFGIFNSNIAPGLRAHGVPHPVEYLVAADGTVVRKYFVPNYQHRVTGSAVALREFGAVAQGAPAATLRSEAVTVAVGLASATGFAGQEIGFFAKFEVEPGWHVYGSSVASPYTPTSVRFDDPKVVNQTFQLPPAESVRLAALDETLPVHSGSFQGIGSVLLKFPLDAGPIKLTGHVQFQQCSATVCEPPVSLPFELALTLERFMVA